MKIAVPRKSIRPNRGRCFPDTVKKFKALGAEVVVEPGAGHHVRPARFRVSPPAGATVSADALKVPTSSSR